MNFISKLAATALSLTVLASAPSFAQEKKDGQWRGVLGAGASLSSGNSDSKSLNLNGDYARATAADRLSVYGNINYGSSGGKTTAESLRAGTRYDYNLTNSIFAFGSGELSKDKIANLSLGLNLGAGLGTHLVDDANTKFTVFGGVGYGRDKYIAAKTIDGKLRDTYNYTSLLLGEESSHKLSDTTSFKQRLVLYPNLGNSKGLRATFDAGLAVSMSKATSLTVGLSHRYNGDPGVGVKKGDTLLVTGVAVNFN